MKDTNYVYYLPLHPVIPWDMRLAAVLAQEINHSKDTMYARPAEVKPP